MQTAQHALVLNLHQPAFNLENLLAHDSWEAREILYAIDRIPRALWPYQDLGRVHLSLSGTLLETLSSPAFQDKVYGIVKCGDLLWHLQNTSIIEILGTGHYHPVLPLIPEHRPGPADRALARHRAPPVRAAVPRLLAARARVQRRADPAPPAARLRVRHRRQRSRRAARPDALGGAPLPPHVAEYQGQTITVIVRDRELSNAQESGNGAGVVPGRGAPAHQAPATSSRWSPRARTATTAAGSGTPPRGSNFWSALYAPCSIASARGDDRLRPTFLGGLRRSLRRLREGEGPRRRVEHGRPQRTRLRAVDRARAAA